MAGSDVIGQLAVVLVAAGAVALLFHRLRLPLVLGYLLAGALVGPFSRLALVRDASGVADFATLGVFFLLFSLGLDFRLARLRRVGPVALLATALEVGLMVTLGFLVARAAGASALDALFLGSVLAISSTTLITRLIAQSRELDEATREAALGILVVEDVFAIVLLALLAAFAGGGSVTVASAALVLGRAALFVAAGLALGFVLVPRLVDHAGRARRDEILVVAVFAIALAFAWLATAIGLSGALGAFLAGALVAEARSLSRVEIAVAPLRDLFTAVFFVAIGMLVDPAVLVARWPLVLGIALVAVLGKIFAVSFSTLVSGYAPRDALRIGIALAMIGEFSFIVAKLGADLGVTDPAFVPIVVAVSAVTTLVSPALLSRSDAIVDRLARVAPRPLTSALALLGRRRAARVPAVPRLRRALLVRTLAYLVLVVAVALGGRVAVTAAVARIGLRLVVPGDVPVVVASLAVLVEIPLLIGFLSNLLALARDLADVAMPARLADDPGADAARAVLAAVFTLFFALLGAVLVVPLTLPFFPTLPVLAGVVLVVALATALSWRAMRRFHRRVEEAVDTVFVAGPHGEERKARDAVLRLVREEYPWEAHVESVVLPPRSAAAARRLRDLRLRQVTGATVVSVERKGERIVNPPPDFVLAAGDVVVLMGERDQAAAAKKVLASTLSATAAPEGAVETGEIRVPAGSPLVGMTLAGTRLRERTGASVVAIRRGEERLLNPPPITRLAAEDVLLVLGSVEQIRDARRAVESGE